MIGAAYKSRNSSYHQNPLRRQQPYFHKRGEKGGEEKEENGKKFIVPSAL